MAAKLAVDALAAGQNACPIVCSLLHSTRVQRAQRPHYVGVRVAPWDATHACTTRRTTLHDCPLHPRTVTLSVTARFNSVTWCDVALAAVQPYSRTAVHHSHTFPNA